MSVWHDSTELVTMPNSYVLAVTCNGTWIKMCHYDLNALLEGIHRPMIKKWAYIKDLEELQ